MPSACALGIFSGKIISIFGIAERLRTLRYPIFTGEVVAVSGICSACFLRKRGAAVVTLSVTPYGVPAPPKGGAGIERSEMTERVRSRGYPLRLTAFASSPKGTPFGAAAKFPAIAKAVPLRVDFPRPGEDVA